MPLTRERKEELVAEYADLLRESQAVIFTDFSGLDNRQMTELRRSIMEADGVYQVTKLTLLELALEEAGYPAPEEMLSGAPVAVGFCLEEIPAVAKAITEFMDDNEDLALYGGLMPDAQLSNGQIEALAKLPPLDTLRAQLLGTLDAPASQLVGVLQAGVAQIVNVIDAYAQSGEEAGEAAAA